MLSEVFSNLTCGTFSTFKRLCCLQLLATDQVVRLAQLI